MVTPFFNHQNIEHNHSIHKAVHTVETENSLKGSMTWPPDTQRQQLKLMVGILPQSYMGQKPSAPLYVSSAGGDGHPQSRQEQLKSRAVQAVLKLVLILASLDGCI